MLNSRSHSWVTIADVAERAGVNLGLLRNWDIRQPLGFANAVAAVVISRPRKGTAGYPALSRVEEFLARWCINKERQKNGSISKGRETE